MGEVMGERTLEQHKQAEPILRHRDHLRELRLQSSPAIPRGRVAVSGPLEPPGYRVGARGRIGRGGSVQSMAHQNLLGVFQTVRTAGVWLWMRRTLAVRSSGCQQSLERRRSLGRRSRCCCISRC
jgi:hypothetical protein